MTTLIATSVVRGSRQGESHGGVYLIDLARQRAMQAVDWNAMDIDWQGRGWDRGLRGIDFDGDRIFIAASDELFVFDKDFKQIGSYRCAYLKHCHEIFRYRRRLYLTSTGFDSILGFDLDENAFSWGLSIQSTAKGLVGTPFLPTGDKGPAASNELHLNSVVCTNRGLYFAGLKTGGLYVYDGRRIVQGVSLPAGTHNARPYKDGVLFNDTRKDIVRFVKREGPERVFKVPRYDPAELTHTDFDDSRTARQAFGRGLCQITDSLIAAGSSPSTVTLHNLESMQTTLSVNLSMDVRSAIHGLEVWPYDSLPEQEASG
ncbi:MAG: hypothetical protein AAFX56_13700 [Pseudomonadota bacterium]